MDKQRKKILDLWLSKIYSSKYDIEVASSDASFRKYYRIQSTKKSKILMDAPPENEPIDSFLDIHSRLEKTGVNVPDIYEINKKHGLILMEDFGDNQYLHQLSDETVYCLYTDALDALNQIQTKTDTSNLKLFDENELIDEMYLFKDWFLFKNLNLSFKQAGSEFIDNCFKSIVKLILEIPTTFVHRDYHSRNLMVTDKNNPGILDFQDALLGPITYDLASLLRDCYIKWDKGLIDRMIDSYYRRVRAQYSQISLEEFNFWFDITAVQRHIKAIGIFSRLKFRDGKKQFMNDIPRTYSYINETINKYSELDDFKSLMTDLDIINKL
mgnify:CR=1 FL=1